MAALKLSLLGTPQILLDEEPVEFSRRKGMALLVYLAVTGERQPRESLAALFWPESKHDRARAALRRDLSELNLLLEGQWLDMSRERVGLRTGYWLDVTEFQRYLAHEDADTESLIAAADLYRGDFLAGFTLLDSPQFDEWQFFQGESLRQALASVLEKLVGILRNQTNYEKAILYARRWLALDPLHESVHRQLMMLYAQAGQQAAALRQYDLVRQTLQDELGVSPSDETATLHDNIRTGKVVRTAPVTLAPRFHNLPTQTTTFIGRRAEVAEIKRYLLDEPGCRLLNLVGPGGIGKTRLAQAVAMQTFDAFPDGVYFIALAPVGEVEYVVPAIAEALRLTFFANAEPKAQLLDYLGPKKLLLVVDNFEHLLVEAGLLSEILQRAQDVVVLATSRERLNLQEEWVYDVQGLSFPTAKDETQDLREYGAVDLFMQRARQIVANFAPSTSEMSAIIQICQLVEGMPLGLELAAPWTRTLSCHEIAEEIQLSLDFLTTTARNVPERHRSIRVVFEQTWRRLSDQEQVVLQHLSVFRGGCTRQAAEEVTGATLQVLSALLDKALLRRTNTGRYELHELIRQFAEAQLQMAPHAAERARQQHQDFFVRFLEARAAGVKGHRQTQTLAELEADIENIRLAWRGAVANRESAAIARSAECLFVYYLYRNGYDEGILEFSRTMTAFALLPDQFTKQSWLGEPVVANEEVLLAGYLLTCLGYFVAHRRDLRRGQELLEQALALLRRTIPGDPRRQGLALLWLGWAHYFQGQLTEGKRYGREGLTLLTETADHWGATWAVLLIGACLRDGRPAEAETVYQRGLPLCRETGDQVALSYISFNLGATFTSLGHYPEAQHHIDLGVAISHQLNNQLGLGYALLRRGQLQIAQGQYRQAVQSLQQSWSYFNKIGTVHASRAQLYLGVAHYLQRDYDLAEQLYLQALAGFEAAHNRLEPSRCLSGLGCLAYDQAELSQAEQFQRESLALLYATEPEPALVAATLRYLGQVMVASGQDRQAEATDYFRQALVLALDHQLAPLALAVSVDVAQLLTQAGERERALELLTLVEQHEASTFETQRKAHDQLLRLVGPSPLEKIQTAKDQTPDLWATVRTLLPQLANHAIQNW